MSAQTIDQPTSTPEIDDDNWQIFSACAANNWSDYLPSNPHDPEVFFPKRLEGGQCAPAKALCAMCPVRVQCLTEGMKEPSGVWGGLSEKERRTAQKMSKDGKTAEEILAYFDSLVPKRRRKATLTIVPTADQTLEAASLTGTVIEQFIDVTGTVPTGATNSPDDRLSVAHFRDATSALVSLEPSSEVLREQRRRRNGLR